MAYSTKAVANYILDLGKRHGVAISPMKLQKLVFFAHGWHLAISQEPLIDEQIEAWKYGPVVPSLFHSLKHFGNAPIQERLTEDELSWDLVRIQSHEPSLDDYRDDDSLRLAKAVIEKTWEEYGSLSATRLSNMTHEPDGPWRKRVDDFSKGLPRSTDIPQEYIYDHFKASLDRHLQESS